MQQPFERVLVIGGTGMFGSSITRALESQGHRVSVGSRRPASAGATPHVSVDVSDVGSVKQAITGVDAVVVVFPLSVGPRDGFVAERDGMMVLLEALSNEPTVPVLKLSEIGAGSDPSFFDLEAKATAERILTSSGHPFFILRPTWVMESWPNLVVRPKDTVLVPEVDARVYWTSTRDVGAWFAAALRRWDSVEGKTMTAQGPDAVSIREVGHRYANARKLTPVPLPLVGLEVEGDNDPQSRTLHEMFRYYNRRDEPFLAQETWNILGEPQVDLESFLNSGEERVTR